MDWSSQQSALFPTVRHARSGEDECLFTYEHLRILVAHPWPRAMMGRSGLGAVPCWIAQPWAQRSISMVSMFWRLSKVEISGRKPDLLQCDDTGLCAIKAKPN